MILCFVVSPQGMLSWSWFFWPAQLSSAQLSSAHLLGFFVPTVFIFLFWFLFIAPLQAW